MARYTGGMQVSGEHYWKSEHAQTRTDEPGGVEGNRELPPPRPKDPLAPVGDELDLLLRYLPTGFALFAYGIARQVKERVRQSAIELAATLQPGRASAGEAHFTGEPAGAPSGEESVEGESSPALEMLEREIAGRKQKK